MQETRQDFHASTELVQRTRLLQRHNRQAVGRPQKEVDHLELLSTIINIVQAWPATNDRRRRETLCSLTTLDDLHQELTNLGFKCSHWAVYDRLLPRRGFSREGKRYVQTISVKLLRPEHSLRKNSIDCMYANSFFDAMMSINELLGGDANLPVEWW